MAYEEKVRLQVHLSSPLQMNVHSHCARPHLDGADYSGVSDSIRRELQERSGHCKPRMLSQFQSSSKTLNPSRGSKMTGSGKRTSNLSYHAYSVLVIVLVIAMMIAGVVIALLGYPIAGWTVLAVGIVIGTIASALWIRHLRRLRQDVKRNAEANEMMEFHHLDVTDFPFDPVLQRGITSLVYHGNHECSSCTQLRNHDDKEGDKASLVGIKLKAEKSDGVYSVIPSEPNENVESSRKSSDSLVKNTTGVAPAVVVHNAMERAPHDAVIIDVNNKQQIVAGDNSNNNNNSKNNYHNAAVVSKHTRDKRVTWSSSQSGGSLSKRVKRSFMKKSLFYRDSLLTARWRKQARNREWNARKQNSYESYGATETTPTDAKSREEVSTPSKEAIYEEIEIASTTDRTTDRTTTDTERRPPTATAKRRFEAPQRDSFVVFRNIPSAELDRRLAERLRRPAPTAARPKRVRVVDPKANGAVAKDRTVVPSYARRRADKIRQGPRDEEKMRASK